MKYRTDVSPTLENSSQAEILRQISDVVAPGGRVLDLGCASGDLGAALTEAGFEVTGVERDPAAARIASDRMHAVVQADLAELDLAGLQPPFDALVLGDVLEHLADPAEVLEHVLPALADDGVLITSIPNVAHGSVALALLQGRWAYTPEGLLDATHLRFFTLESAAALLTGAGLRIDAVCSTILDVLGTEVVMDDEALPGSIVEWVRDRPYSTAYQFIFTCRRATADAPASTPLPAVIPLVSLERPLDEHARRRRAEEHESLVRERREAVLAATQRDRYDRLTTQDHVVALEGELARMRYEHDRALEDLHQVREELIETHSHLADAIADSQQAHARLHEALEAAVPEPPSLPERAIRKAARTVRSVRR